MNKQIIDYTEIQLRERLSKAGLNSQDIDRAIADYMRYRESEVSNIFAILSYKELQSLGAERIF